MPLIQCSHVDHITWITNAPDTYTLSGVVDVWRLALSANMHQLDGMLSLLSADETVRANSYLQEKDRNRFILSRGMLRQILANYLNEPAATIRFAIGENKKPFVQAQATTIHYNVAHAGDWVLIAVSDSAVGVDIEHINPAFDYTEVLQLCFSNEEANFIQSRKTFYKLWTRKEALVKATGKGIDNDLPFVPCMDGTHDAQAEKIATDKDWSVSSFDIDEEYIGSIACDALVRNIIFMIQ